MKVVILVPCLLNGGTEHQTLSLAKTLTKKGLHVKVIIYFECDQGMINLFNSAGIEVDCLQWKRDKHVWSIVVELYKIINVEKPSLVHVQYMAPGALPILAAKLAGMPRIIATVHQPWTPSHGRSAKLILRTAALMCERFTVVSQNAEFSWFGSSHLINVDKPIVEQPRHLTLYNAVDVTRLMAIESDSSAKPSLEDHGIPNSAIVIGTVARLRHEKGVDILIRGFARLVSSDQRPIFLVIVGDGPDHSKLIKLADSLGVAKRVLCVGTAPWEQAMKWMAQMDIVVVPSRFEGFGLTAAEAMAMSKPIVVSNTHGLTELIDHNVNGLVFDVDDVDQLSNHLSELLANSDWAQTLGKHAQTTIGARYDLPIYERNIATLYGLVHS